MNNKSKTYAVVRGHKPGLYTQWFGPDGAEAQIKGFPNALHKSFSSFPEAEEWFSKQEGDYSVQMKRDVPNRPKTVSPVIHLEALEAGKLVIYTDGSSRGNPGPGGYGAVLLAKGCRKELSGGYAVTTNNRMELMACIVGLGALKSKQPVVLYSDSAYVVNGIQKGWAKKWRDNNWQRVEAGEVKEVKNADLWMQLLVLCQKHNVEFIQIKGHAGVKENERCDQLSVRAAQRPNLKIDPGFELG